MSPNRGRHIVRQAPPKRLERPSLDRPSLFAGMEAGDSIVPEDDDTPRGGILSTLETVRQRKPLPGRSDDAPSGGLWQNRILWGLMGAGVVALLGSFVMIVSEGHSQRLAAQEAITERAAQARRPLAVAQDVRDLNVLASPAAGSQASASTPMASSPALVTGTGTGNAPATIVEAGLAQPGPAVIGVVPTPALKAAAAPVSPVPPMPAISPEPPAPAAALAQAAAPVPAVATKATPVRADAPAPVVAQTATDKPASTRRSNRKHPDDDVALLEAMFHHAQTRSGAPAAGPSVGEQLKTSCGKLSGAAAATCRARICVSNPGASVCHDAP